MSVVTVAHFTRAGSKGLRGSIVATVSLSLPLSLAWALILSVVSLCLSQC